MTKESVLSNPGSSAVKPDLDWSQVKETISMLCLAMAQIETSLCDSARSVNDLSETFTGMAKDAKEITELCKLSENSDQWLEHRQKINESAQKMHQQMQRSIMAFQFYDRLTQKLSHVNLSLSHLGDLINTPNRLYIPDEWLKIQDEIRGNYTMECERIMFDQIMRGASVSEALELYRHQFEQTESITGAEDSSDDDIELF